MGIRMLTVGLVVIALAGCGGGDSDSPESGAQTAVEDFVEALANKDFSLACGHFTPELKDQLGGDRCGAALTALAAEGTLTPDVEITDVRVAGNKAAVDATISSGQGPPAEHTLQLLESGGVWRI